MFSPFAASARGLICTRTAGRWPPPMLTRPTPGCCEIFCARRVSAIDSISGQVHRLGGQRQGQDRRVGRVHLGVDRRRRQVGRQQVARGVDRGLHLLFGDVQAYVEAELKCDDRGAGRVDENIWFRLGISPNCTSSGAVTEEVITSGLAPG